MTQRLYRLAADVAADTDPRAANAREFARDANGKVVGMNLPWMARPETPWELVQAVLLDENQALGNHVATCSALDNGMETPVYFWLTWPYPEMTQRGLPGNPNRQHEITSKFAADKIGPLGIYIGDAAGNVQSDVIWGLGLPNGAHVCFFLTWRKRGAVAPPDDGSDSGDGADAGASVMLLREIRDLVKAGFRL